jgi:hypothetical protein
MFYSLASPVFILLLVPSNTRILILCHIYSLQHFRYLHFLNCRFQLSSRLQLHLHSKMPPVFQPYRFSRKCERRRTTRCHRHPHTGVAQEKPQKSMDQSPCHIMRRQHTGNTEQTFGTGTKPSHGNIPTHHPVRPNFLSVPPEIRLMIYEYLLVSPTGHVTFGVRNHNRRERLEDSKWHLLEEPNKNFRFQSLLEWNPRHFIYDGLRRSIENGCWLSPIDTSICQTSRLIRDESFAFLWARNTLFFITPNSAVLVWTFMFGPTKFQPNSESAFLGRKYIKHVSIHVDEHITCVDPEYMGDRLSLAQFVWYWVSGIKSLVLDIRMCRFPSGVIHHTKGGIAIQHGWRFPLYRLLSSEVHGSFEDHILNLTELVGKRSSFCKTLRYGRNLCFQIHKDHAEIPTRKLYLHAEFFHSPFWKNYVAQNCLGHSYGLIAPSIMVESWAVAWGGEIWVDGVLCFRDGAIINFPLHLQDEVYRGR